MVYGTIVKHYFTILSKGGGQVSTLCFAGLALLL
jgi:hypothetical protein